MIVRGGSCSGIFEYVPLAALERRFRRLTEFGDLVAVALNEPCLALAEPPCGGVIAFPENVLGRLVRSYGWRLVFLLERFFCLPASSPAST